MRISVNNWFIVFLLSITLIAGCATNREIYYWGEYEQLIHDSYVTPGAADSYTQIEKLSADIQKAEANGKKIAPGIYAHLGFLYAAQGKESQSQSAFMEEHSLYPESRVFIDGMMNRVKQIKEEH